jgi:hypothetical protein
VVVVADRAALEEKDRAFDALHTMTFVESQRVGLLLGGIGISRALGRVPAPTFTASPRGRAA